MRYLFVILICLTLPVLVNASAANVFIGQGAAGTADGSSCANRRDIGFFNTAGNWGAGAAQIGAGTIVHLCGTVTATVNTTALTFHGSGSAGNPITLLFESGAQLTSPAWPGGGAINTSAQSWLVINGDLSGGRQGIIQATANGTGLGNTLNSAAIFADNSANCVIKNIQIINIYVHTAVSDSSGDSMGIRFFTSADNLLIDNILVHDVRWSTNATSNGLQISNSEFHHVDHGATTAQNSASPIITGIKIFGNHFHDYNNWDTTANLFHHDGIHIWANTGGRIEDAQIYNNLFDGRTGNSATAQCYIETVAGSPAGTHTSNVKVFNNVFIADPAGPTSRMIWFDGGAGNPTSNAIYNNFIDGGTAATTALVQINGQSLINFRNNIVKLNAFGISLVDFGGSTTQGTINTNTYSTNPAGGNGNSFVWNGTRTDVFATWRSNCSCDAAGQQITSAQINATSDGHLNSGSLAIGAGANLTSLGITALDSDKAGIARPGAGAWDAGAYQFASGSCSPVISSVTLNPTSVTGGTSLAGTVTISCVPAADTAVSLSSSDTTVVTVPPAVMVLASQTTASFTVTTFPFTCVTQTAVITATLSGSQVATLTTTPATYAYMLLTGAGCR